MSLSLFHMIFNCHVCYFVIIFLFPICCCNFNKHWFRTFIAISDLARRHFNAMSPVGIYSNRTSYNSLIYLVLLDYFMVDHVVHSKFNASNTPTHSNTHTPSGQGNEVAKANHLIYSSVGLVRDVGGTSVGLPIAR